MYLLAKHAPERWASTIYLTVALSCVIFCNVYIVSKQASIVGETPPAPDAETLLLILERFFVLPGPFSGDDSLMFYPILPWLPLCLTGCAVGPIFGADAMKAHQYSLYGGLSLLLIFILLRFLGGTVGNYRGWPRGTGSEEGRELNPLMAFFNVCKYPPSLAYDCITMAVNLTLLHLLSKWEDAETSTLARPWLAFGRTPLLFYIIHFYVLSLIGVVIRHTTGQEGIILPYVVLVWSCLLLPIMFILCERYATFKASQPVTSLWRFL